jgi:hypothetical protein
VHEIKLPRDVVNRVERRWASRFAPMHRLEGAPSPSAGESDDPLQSPQVQRLLGDPWGHTHLIELRAGLRVGRHPARIVIGRPESIRDRERRATRFGRFQRRHSDVASLFDLMGHEVPEGINRPAEQTGPDSTGAQTKQ